MQACSQGREAAPPTPPADGAVPPIPRDALSASLCTPLPQGLRRDERSLSLRPARASLSSHQDAQVTSRPGQTVFGAAAGGTRSLSSGTWTRPSSLSTFLPSLLSSFLPNPQPGVGFPLLGPWGRNSHPQGPRGTCLLSLKVSSRLMPLHQRSRGMRPSRPVLWPNLFSVPLHLPRRTP